MDFALTSAQIELQRRARRLAEESFRPRAAAYDASEQWPADNVAELVKHGFMGMTLDRQYGGQEASILDLVLVVEELARCDAATARIVVDSNAGAAGILQHYGTPEQKARYLPLFPRGEKPAISITERAHGSDAARLDTTAVRDGDAWVVNGGKWFITGAGQSTVYVVFARVPAEDTVGCFVLEKGMPGFTFGPRIPTMGIRAIPEGELLFHDVRLPLGQRIPAPGGFKDLLTAYNAQRVGAAAVALGLAQGAFDLAVEYSRERRQFDQPIGEFQGIQWSFADMAIQLDAARLLVHRAAWSAGRRFPDPVLSAKAKAFTAEMAIRVTNQALQTFGSYGYSRNFPLERMARDARMFTIAGGTVEMLRNLVGRQIYRKHGTSDRPPAP